MVTTILLRLIVEPVKAHRFGLAVARRSPWAMSLQYEGN
jgi:hypothetical protein